MKKNTLWMLAFALISKSLNTLKNTFVSAIFE